IGGTREELVAIDKAEKRHRLLFERMNDVPVVDDMTTQIAVGAAAPHGQDEGRAKPAVQVIVVETHAQPVADEPGGRGVEDLAQSEAAGADDVDERLLEVIRAAGRQRLQRRAFESDPLAIAGVAAANDLADETAIGGKIVEGARAAQQKRL